MESGLITALEGACPDSSLGSGYVGPGQTQPPTINCGAAIARASSTFAAYISLSGPTAAIFKTWSITPDAPADWGSWTNWVWDTSFTGLKLNNTSDPKTKKLTASKTPAIGDFSYRVTVSYGSISTSTICKIKINCVPSCPLASSMCIGVSYKGFNGCGSGTCNVEGTECCDNNPDDWSPLPALYCTSENFTQTSICGNKRDVKGTKCCVTCSGSKQPNCQTVLPGGGASESSETCCGAGEKCYKCPNNFSYEAATKNCVPDNKDFYCNTPLTEDSAKLDIVWEWNMLGAPGSYSQTYISPTVWSPPDSTTVYDVTPSATSCHYKCKAGNHYETASNNCQPDYCGDGIVNGLEQCDPNAAINTQLCTGNIKGLPAWCASAVTGQGVRHCGAAASYNQCQWDTDCTLDPVPSKTATGCGFGPGINNAICCEILSCAQDACGCCGATGASLETPGLLAYYKDPVKFPLSDYLVVPDGNYSVHQQMSVTWNPAIPASSNYCPGGSGAAAGPVISTPCLKCDDKSGNPLIPPPGACKLFQNMDGDKKGWVITATHATAYYKCWGY